MTLDGRPDGHERDDEEKPPPQGRIAPTSVGVLVGSGVSGLVVGWAIRPMALRFGYAEPRVSLTSVALLAFVVAIVGWSAYATRRTVRRSRHDLPAHQAVNRLVLGKACAIAGAVIAGGWFGYALAQLGVADPAADQRLWRSLVAGAVGLALVAAALLLEHACRVPPDERE